MNAHVENNPNARRQLIFAFGGLLAAMFIAALDQTIMATALPTIAGQLGGLTELSWIVTVYVLGAAASTPLWGKASDLFGRKTLIRAAILIFIAFSALSGAAQSIGELIAFRAAQGIGAGGVMTLAMATVGMHSIREADVVIRPKLHRVSLRQFSEGRKFISAGRDAVEQTLPALRQRLPWL